MCVFRFPLAVLEVDARESRFTAVASSSARIRVRVATGVREVLAPLRVVLRWAVDVACCEGLEEDVL